MIKAIIRFILTWILAIAIVRFVSRRLPDAFFSPS